MHSSALARLSSSFALSVAVLACGSDSSNTTSAGDGGPGSNPFPSGCAPTCPVTNVAHGGYQPTSLVVYGDRVFFTAVSTSSASGIYSVPKAGGDAKKLAAASAGGSACKGLATDGTLVYYADQGITSGLAGIYSVPVDGGTPTKLVATAGNVGCIAMDDSSLYWLGPGPKGVTGVSKMAKSGGDSTALVTTGAGFKDITVRKGIVYWAESNYVRKVSATGGDSITLTSDNHAGFSSIAVDDAFVYVENYADATIARVPLDGGARETLAKAQTTPHGLTVDGTSLYWGVNLNDNTQDRVVRGSTTGDFITPLTSSVNATNFAVDEQYVYWTSVNEGAIRRTPK